LNNVSGTGQLQQVGTGTTWLGSGLSYTGGTVITGGALIVNRPHGARFRRIDDRGRRAAGGLDRDDPERLDDERQFHDRRCPWPDLDDLDHERLGAASQ